MGLLIHIVLVFHFSDETQVLAPRSQQLQPQSLVVKIIPKKFWQDRRQPLKLRASTVLSKLITSLP
jgi:hypothetical protein